jgi:hypothetical protein
MKELIKTQINGILAYGVTYNDIQNVLNDLIKEQNKRRSNNKYQIDLEGDIICNGTLQECENFIKSNKIHLKRNKKEYGLSTPTGDNIVLIYSDEFSHLF